MYGWYFRHELQNRRGGWRLLQVLTRLKPIVPIRPDRRSTVWIDVRSANELALELLRYRQPYEEHLQRLFRRLVRPTDTVVDVGANMGLHTVLFDQLAAQVLAVEPQPRLQQALRRTIADLKHTTLLSCALADFDGEALFRVEGDHSGGTIGTEGERVNVRKLDDIVGGQDLHFMKVDVEGHELAVFRGARATITRCMPIIVYEQLKPTGPGPHDFLEGLGYQFQAVMRTGQSQPWSMEPEWCDVLAMPPTRLRDVPAI